MKNLKKKIFFFEKYWFLDLEPSGHQLFVFDFFSLPKDCFPLDNDDFSFFRVDVEEFQVHGRFQTS